MTLLAVRLVEPDVRAHDLLVDHLAVRLNAAADRPIRKRGREIVSATEVAILEEHIDSNQVAARRLGQLPAKGSRVSTGDVARSARRPLIRELVPPSTALGLGEITHRQPIGEASEPSMTEQRLLGGRVVNATSGLSIEKQVVALRRLAVGANDQAPVAGLRIFLGIVRATRRAVLDGCIDAGDARLAGVAATVRVWNVVGLSDAALAAPASYRHYRHHNQHPGFEHTDHHSHSISGGGVAAGLLSHKRAEQVSRKART